jgi:polyphenol oxidase
MVPYLLSSSLSDIKHVKHGFFTREGGVSQGDFATLNTGLENGDLIENVQENRRRISATLGFDAKKLITTRQIHSPNVIVVDQPFEGAFPEADGLITTTPDLLIGVMTADCVPVLLSTAKGDMVAAVHAGWRGAIAGVLENTFEKMKTLGGIDIRAALGPCIWQDTYEVSQEFYDNLQDLPSFFKPGNRLNHWQFDLPGYVIYRLQQAGLRHIETSPVNTFTDSARFFSCRRRTILGQARFGNGLSGIGIVSKGN